MKKNNTWGFAILKCINSMYGEAYLQDIYERIGKFITLTDAHYEQSYGTYAYHHEVRSSIANLKNEGYLEWQKRGCYSLTQKGKDRLKGKEIIEEETDEEVGTIQL